ncbi:MAG: tetratricopeptide repeat protein [Myxococcota bacterium]
MAFWNKKPEPYNRTRILDAAEKARSKGSRKKAIALYQEILAKDPNDAQVNARIAPLLHRVGKTEDAEKAFGLAAQSFVDKGFIDKALAVYAQAVELFPLDPRLWKRVGELTMERGRKADAVKALMQGAQQLTRKKPSREAALLLLEQAVGYDPFHLEATFALGRLLKRLGRKDEGMQRLEALQASLAGPARRRVRRAQFYLSPGFGTLWRWLWA